MDSYRDDMLVSSVEKLQDEKLHCLSLVVAKSTRRVRESTIIIMATPLALMLKEAVALPGNK